MARSWDPYLTERDRRHLAASGFGKRGDERAGFGVNPAILVVDDYYSVLGLEREELFEAIKKWPMSTGLDGWTAIDRTVELLRAARANDVPIIYVHGMGDDPLKQVGFWGARVDMPARQWTDALVTPDERAMANEIVAEIAPVPGDLVLNKAAASAFHGTPLVFQLNYLNIDTVITCGETTSGCVRASVVDGATYRYRMAVVEECTFDRTQASHYINLFDMHTKYADVVTLDETVAYLDSIGVAKRGGATDLASWRPRWQAAPQHVETASRERVSVR